MKERRIVFAPEAVEDLVGVYDWIAAKASPTVALTYIERVEAFCLRLSIGSERGHRRPDIRPDLRIIGFEQRLTIAFIVKSETVTILRIFAAGQNWESTF